MPLSMFVLALFDVLTLTVLGNRLEIRNFGAAVHGVILRVDCPAIGIDDLEIGTVPAATGPVEYEDPSRIE